MSPPTTLERLAARVREEGAPLVVRPAGDSGFGPDPLGQLAASGPRSSARAAQYAFIVEAVREGYLCHYGRSRLLDEPDSDLALLAGDLFYAIGISGLAELNDLESTGILSDLIRVAAELQAAGRPDLAGVLWLSQIVALACGKDEEQAKAVEALGAGEAAAAEALEAWSRATADSHGAGRAFENARTAIDSRPSNP